MARALIVIAGAILILGACTQRSICPAFQSAYIYDKDALRKKFSYFQEDSTPKVLTASKNQYLVAEPTPYKKKLRELRTVQMTPVPVIVPDSLTNEDSVSLEELDRAARSVIDSTFIEDRPVAEASAAVQDSVYVITKDKELRLLKYNGPDSLVYDAVADKYVAQKPEYYVKDVRLNIDQDNYMWYLRDYLVLPDVRLIKMQQGAEKENAARKEKRERKKGKGLFRNLFKKKTKESQDSTTLPAPQEEFDFIDVDTLTQAEPGGEEVEASNEFFAPAKKNSEAQDADKAAPVPAEERKRNRNNDEATKEEEAAGF